MFIGRAKSVGNILDMKLDNFLDDDSSYMDISPDNVVEYNDFTTSLDYMNVLKCSHIKKIYRVIVYIVLTISAIVTIVVGYTAYVLNSINYDKEISTTPIDNYDIGNNNMEETTNVSENNPIVEENYVLPDTVEGVTTILLCGIEEIGGGGRTDSMMLVTVDTNRNTVQVASLMRDLYVKIPGYKNNRLNSSYQMGGIKLLRDTIELNFDIKVDYYATVNFDSFEKVIDLLGGVEVKLSKVEADYLNRTNYISDKKNRVAVEGKQMFNGNQALGYSRVRKVPTWDGKHSDYGRTHRQRQVIQALFQKYKQKNIVEIMALAPNILSVITTDMQKDKVLSYVVTVLGMGLDDIQMYRVPADNEFTGKTIRKMQILYMNDIQKVRKNLQSFLYGEDGIDSKDYSYIHPNNFYDEIISQPTPKVEVKTDVNNKGVKEDNKKHKDKSDKADKKPKKNTKDTKVTPTPTPTPEENKIETGEIDLDKEDVLDQQVEDVTTGDGDALEEDTIITDTIDPNS